MIQKLPILCFWIKKEKYFNIFCKKIWSIKKKTVILQTNFYLHYVSVNYFSSRLGGVLKSAEGYGHDKIAS